MTIDEVIAWQHSFIAAGSPSSGVGRYMLINNTMRGLIGALGLSGKERFDQQMQDIFAVQLLSERGLERYLAGSKSADDFMNVRVGPGYPTPNLWLTDIVGHGRKRSRKIVTRLWRARVIIDRVTVDARRSTRL